MELPKLMSVIWVAVKENKHLNKKGKLDKTPIIGIVNRDTKQVKAIAIPNADRESLLPKIGGNVKMGSTIVTDTYHKIIYYIL